MPATKNDLYFISPTASEAERLKWQHRLTVEAFSYLIHPKIESQLPSDARVADLGTGTGEWLEGAAEILPDTTQLVGFDLSSAQFPSSPKANIKLEIADVKQSFPTELHGTFDLVHVRYIVFAMYVDDWATVLSNIMQLLKPGGAVQWTESHYETMSCLRSCEEYRSYPTLTDILDKFMGPVGSRTIEGQKKLCEVIHECGLEGVEFDTVSTEREAAQRPSWARMLAPGYSDWAKKALGLTDDETTKLRDGILRDVDNGAYLRQDLFTIIGWKPSSK